MKRSVIASAALLVLASACTTLNDQQPVSISVGLPERVAAPIRNREGNVLSGRFTGSEAQIVKLELGTAIPRAELAADGVITGMQLATRAGGSPTGRSLAVVTSCPGGFGDQPEYEEIRTCLSPPAMASIELDDEGRAIGPQISLPPGLPEGGLFASESAFVWEGWDPANRAIYADGQWRRLDAVEPATTRVTSRCSTKKDLWVLHGDSGPKSVTGPDNALANPSPNLTLFSYLLDGSADNPWVQVPVAGLEGGKSAELACGDEEAFVRVGNSLYSTASPAQPVGGIESGIDELRGNPARRPVLFLEDRTCAIVAAGGRLLPGRELQSSATSPRASTCDSVPWPKGNGFIGLTQDQLGNITLGNW
jgi:hypothetical protein